MLVMLYWSIFGIVYVQIRKKRYLHLQNPCEVANIKLLNFQEIANESCETVLTQNKDFQSDSEKMKAIKKELQTRKISNYKTKLEELRNPMNVKMKFCNDISNKIGSSN